MNDSPDYAQTPDEVELFLQLGAIRDFATGCRELVNVAEDIDRRTADSSPIDVAAQVATQAGVTRDVQHRVHEVFAEAEQQASALVVSVLGESDVAAEEWTADPFALIARTLYPQSIVAQVTNRLQAEFENQPGLAMYLPAYAAANFRRPRKPLLLRALLAVICGQVEVCIVRILRRNLLTNRSYPGINDEQLESDVRKLMMGSGLEGWRKQINDRLGIDIKTGNTEWPAVVELFERRHVLVHREGLVDHRYLRRVPDAPPLGTPLEPTSDYLRQAVDLCEVLTIGLVFQLLARLHPELTDGFSVVASTWAEEAVTEGRQLGAEGYHRLLGALTTNSLEVERSRVEQWLDRQQRLGTDAIHDEVAAWDTESLPQEYKLARLILLGEDDAGLRLLAQLRRDGDISDSDVGSWRLFRRWRDQDVIRSTKPA
ncbi:hypothetical protein LWP59_02695 [Amycolatopsis acidiphila]|uniref:Uncharacterized protein n=1 Tax=Amycolatopsis acidiphila TaxID=715473 RepID=A0A558A3T2_9PSEU|nr:hypothetical protein [Amycolatopsis acidiphila]TVT18913.1 hypothetical protein FNH06_26135 [Amycolatopsis acidiphila]UIJ60612.1 hypothetical protein LWP59_02695 [Amycolatopsis acidiphila]GHG81790.1 hypothetical protein GCM10017788_51850 [Amycolatopsis acidiphila]